MQKNFSHYLKKKKKKKKRKRKTKYLKEKSLKKLKKSWTINFEKLKNFEKNNKILNDFFLNFWDFSRKSFWKVLNFFEVLRITLKLFF